VQGYHIQEGKMRHFPRNGKGRFPKTGDREPELT
jgi:hypothetical protein